MKIVNRVYLLVDCLVPALRAVVGVDYPDLFRKYSYAVSGLDQMRKIGVIVLVDDYAKLHCIVEEFENSRLAVARSFSVKTGRDSRLDLSRISIASLVRAARNELYDKIMRETFTHVIFEVYVPDSYVAYVATAHIADCERPVVLVDFAEMELRAIVRANEWKAMREYVKKNRVRERLITGQPIPEVQILERTKMPKQGLVLPENYVKQAEKEIDVVFKH